MNFKITRDKFSGGEDIWRLEITDHQFFDFPSDYSIIIACKTIEGLLKNLDHYTRKWHHELGKKGRRKKDK
jgi:hypothetical protein